MYEMQWISASEKNGHLKQKVPLPSAATLGFKSLVC